MAGKGVGGEPPGIGGDGPICETGAIADIGIIPTGYERTLPPEAQLVVRARRRALARRGRGRVLDLGGADAHRSLWSTVPAVESVTVLDGATDPQLSGLATGAERYDTIVSVFQLAAASELATTLRRLRAVLADDGELHFLEPARLVGVGGRVQRLIAPPLGLMTGWRADRDVPMALRDAQLSVTDVQRHRVPTVQWWLRQVIEGRAHHALPPGGAPPAAGQAAGAAD